MKIAELVKQLNALKKLHGNVDVGLVNGETGYIDSVKSVGTQYPLDHRMCYDRTKPVNGVVLKTYKA